MSAWRLALGFLTTLPVGRMPEADARALGASLLAYPAVGLLIGVLLCAATLMFESAHPALHAALLLTVWVALTGALHLDGLADMADAWMGGLGDRERTLRILHDPTSGPIAIVVLVLVMLLKWAALLALIGEFAALLLAPLLARSAALVLMLSTPYAREQGLAARLIAHAPRAALWKLLAAVAVVAMLWAPWALLATLALIVLLRRASVRRLGGYTGDTVGALIELVELAVLLVLALTH